MSSSPITDLSTTNSALSQRDFAIFYLWVTYIGAIIICSPFQVFLKAIIKFITTIGLVDALSKMPNVPHSAINLLNAAIKGNKNYNGICRKGLRQTRRAITLYQSSNLPPPDTNAGPLFPPKMMNHLWTRRGAINFQVLFLVVAYMFLSAFCNFGIAPSEKAFKTFIFEFMKLSKFSTLSQGTKKLCEVFYAVLANNVLFTLCLSYKNDVMDEFENYLRQ